MFVIVVLNTIFRINSKDENNKKNNKRKIWDKYPYMKIFKICYVYITVILTLLVFSRYIHNIFRLYRLLKRFI